MAICSSILAWKIPWTEESGGLQSTGSQRVRHTVTEHTWEHKSGQLILTREMKKSHLKKRQH